MSDDVRARYIRCDASRPHDKTRAAQSTAGQTMSKFIPVSSCAYVHPDNVVTEKDVNAGLINNAMDGRPTRSRSW